jgi:hypothetical protein
MKLSKEEHKIKENTKTFIACLDSADKQILTQAVNDMMRPMNQKDFAFYCFQLAETMASVDQWLLDGQYLYRYFKL